MPAKAHKVHKVNKYWFWCDMRQPLWPTSCDVLLLQLCVLCFFQGHKPVLLRTQYRCHPTISAVSNSLFYERQLVDGISAQHRKPLLVCLTLYLILYTYTFFNSCHSLAHARTHILETFFFLYFLYYVILDFLLQYCISFPSYLICTLAHASSRRRSKLSV
jgi:hypothetical protein